MKVKSFEKICVVGLGYIGLPTAVMFASKGKRVVGLDIDHKVVSSINSGKPHIEEPMLGELLEAAVHQGYLSAQIEPEEADVFIIAVPTPFKATADGSHVADLKFINQAAENISSVLKVGDLVILESTSPVGTTEKLVQFLQALRPDLSFPNATSAECDVSMAYCPERVLPGQIVHELIKNDRIIGGVTPYCAAAAVRLYKVFVEGNLITTNVKTSEMSKLTENACRDVQIAFANELSILCDNYGVDVWEVIEICNRHPRINILNPGPGVGGHCIAVDPWFLISENPQKSKLLSAARSVNLNKEEWVEKKVTELANKFHHADIICFGLTYKQNIEDIRESPSLRIFKRLRNAFGERVKAIDPHVNFEKTGIKTISANTFKHAGEILVMLVPHDEFIDLIPKNDLVVDACGLWRNHAKI